MGRMERKYDCLHDSDSIMWMYRRPNGFSLAGYTGFHGPGLRSVPLVGYPQRNGERGSTLAIVPVVTVVLHEDEKSAGVLSLTKKPPCRFHPVFQTVLASGRCQLSRFGLLPSRYVVDGSSPKHPWMGGGRGSGLSPLTRAFAGSKPHTLTRPFTCPCVYCTRPRS